MLIGGVAYQSSQAANSREPSQLGESPNPGKSIEHTYLAIRPIVPSQVNRQDCGGKSQGTVGVGTQRPACSSRGWPRYFVQAGKGGNAQPRSGAQMKYSSQFGGFPIEVFQAVAG